MGYGYNEPVVIRTDFPELMADIAQQRGVSVKSPPYNAKGDGITDDTAAFQAAINYAQTNNIRQIELDYGLYNITSTLFITKPNIQFIGKGRARVASDISGETVLQFYGTGALFQLGADDGQPYDADIYLDYTTDFSLTRIRCVAMSGTGNLFLNNDPTQYYRGGTYGIQDWRNGEVHLNQVAFEHFNFAFWGIGSDINSCKDVILFYNKVGIYLGARSDQNTWDQVYSYRNDTVIWCDGCKVARFNDWQSDNDGSATDSPAKIGSNWSMPCIGVSFIKPWLEHYGGQALTTSFFEVGVGSTHVPTFGDYAVLDLAIEQPFIATNTLASGSPRTANLFTIDQADRISLINPTGYEMGSNLTKLFVFQGTSNCSVFYQMSERQRSGGGTFINNGTGAPTVAGETWGSSAAGAGSSSLYNYSSSGRLFVRQEPTNNQRDFFFSSERDLTWSVQFQSAGLDVPKRFEMQRAWLSGFQIPTTGTYSVGDIIWNRDTNVGRPLGWACTVAGTPGTWAVLMAQAGPLTSIAGPPEFIGQIAIVGTACYMAVGKAAPADWKLIT